MMDLARKVKDRVDRLFIPKPDKETHPKHFDHWQSHAKEVNKGEKFDDARMAVVTDIPATGLHLMSTKNGTTRNMASVDAGFNPNDVTSIKIYRDANYLYDDTVSDLRISAVDGTAFIDNLPAAALNYVNGRNWVTITDSAGKKLEGVLYQKGTGETLGSDLVSGWDFTSGWTSVTGSTIIDSDTFETTSNNRFIIKLYVYVVKGLHKIEYAATVTAGTTGIYDAETALILVCANNNDSYWNGSGGPSNVERTALLKNSVAATTDVTTLSVKQVLTPSISGCTIVDGELSTTENFASVEAGVALNESSYSVTITREREV